MQKQLLCSLLFVASLLRYGFASPSLTIPPLDSVLSTIAVSRPRLLLPPGGFAAIQTKIQSDSVCLRWYASIKKSADAYLASAVSIYAKPDGLRLLDVCREVLKRIYVLGFTYNISGDTAYARRAAQELSAAERFPDWNPVHFLDVGEMTHAFAIGYDWLYGYLSQAQRDSVKNAIITFGFRPYLSAWSTKAWWITTTNNWNLVCNGGVAMGALALKNSADKLCDTIAFRALKSIDSAGAIREYEPDGGWFEGPGYWTYSTQYLFTFTNGCQTALGRDFGLGAVPGLTQTGNFPIYMTGPSAKSFNYADASEGAPQGWWLHWMAQKYSNPLFAIYQYTHASPHPLDIIWYTPGSNGMVPSTTPLDHLFRTVEAASLRSKWLDKNAIFIAMKSGQNGLNHGHLDLGSFVLDANGERWASDLGSDDYNLPSYFSSPTRWTYYRLRAEGHNTLLINPDSTGGQNLAASTTITRFDSRSGSACMITDLTAAYSAYSQSVKRGIALFNNRSQVLVQDEIKNLAPSTVYWFFHTNDTLSLSNANRVALVHRSGKFLDMRIIAPPNASFSIMAAQPLPSSPAPAGQNANAAFNKLTILVSGVDSARIVVLCTPIASAAARSDVVAPEVVPLSAPQWPESQSSGLPEYRCARQHFDLSLALTGDNRVLVRGCGVASAALFDGNGACRGKQVKAVSTSAAITIAPLRAGIYLIRTEFDDGRSLVKRVVIP